ncbi:MAG: hypothetical protein HRT53_20815 [Colwellia sp.]|nr:hypothetical protein [Colwellia sp.]
MDSLEFDRLNLLSEKALRDTATSTELAEFNQLLTIWDTASEVNLFNGKYSPED